MQLNMNDQVRVTLTTYGAQVWNARYDGINIPAEHLPAPCAPGDEVKTQLWDLMQVFGPGIHMGMSEVPFLKNEIEVTK
jgi:hypothetical protein